MTAGRLDAVALIQSSFSERGNGPGNLELIARTGSQLVQFWHPDTSNTLWRRTGRFTP